MQTLFGILSHLTILGGIGLLFYGIYFAIISATTHLEKLLRITAVTTGLLIFFGAKALDLSLAEIMLIGITEQESYISILKFGLFSLVIPACLGGGLVWYFIDAMKHNSNIAVRVMLLIGVFTILQFGEVYMRAIGVGGLAINKAMLPNLVFTISIGLYLTLKYEETT